MVAVEKKKKDMTQNGTMPGVSTSSELDSLKEENAKLLKKLIQNILKVKTKSGLKMAEIDQNFSFTASKSSFVRIFFVFVPGLRLPTS